MQRKWKMKRAGICTSVYSEAGTTVAGGWLVSVCPGLWLSGTVRWQDWGPSHHLVSVP